ncbi:MAG: hypothetical protein KatS3mg022_3674 [Armatimonadota bacterium]|nr:MAG: hypothetical protein KatS3mg022_3674 [Armatimonadota bacterium]
MRRKRLTKQTTDHNEQREVQQGVRCKVVYLPSEGSVAAKFWITGVESGQIVERTPIRVTYAQPERKVESGPIRVVYAQPEQNTEVVQRRYIITNLPPRPPWACSGYGFLIRTNNDKQQEQ